MFASMALGVWAWWAFDIFTLICSYLSTDILSAQTILRVLGLYSYQIPLGISYAMQLHVGNFIGQGNERGIMAYFRVGMVGGLVIGAV